MTGQVSFWQSGTPSYGITTVAIGQTTDEITVDYPNGINTCNESGCANFTLPTGTYSYYASDGSYEWSGSITIIANSCIKIKLL